MEEHGSQDRSLVDAFGAVRIQLLSNLLYLGTRRRGQAKGAQPINQRRQVALRFELRLRWLRSGRCGSKTAGIEEDWLAVDPAVPPAHFEADLLKLLGVDRSACFLLSLRLREG